MKNISKIALLMLLLTSAGLSFAASYPAQVPVTGETGGAAGSGSGVAWPRPRFEAGSGSTQNCIIDKLTGLMWAKNGNLFGPKKNWNDALSVVIQMNKNSSAIGYKLCGFDDWRLPNVIELKSLVNYSQSVQADWLNNQGFANVQANNYWSSTSHSLNSNSAWVVSFNNGDVNTFGKDYDNYVWPVRRAQ